jgi:hypothetical protein
MAQFNLAGLCGTNVGYNKLEVQFEDLKKKLLNDIEAEASALVSNLTGGLVQLDLDLRGLLVQKPIIANVSLQSEIKDLVGLVIGTNQYNAKLATLIKQFGVALSNENKDLAKLIIGAALLIAGKKDICDLIPNMTIPAAGGTVVLLAKNVSQPDKNSVEDIASAITTPVAAMKKANAPMGKRLKKSAELFAAEIIKVDASAGTTGRVTAKTRYAFAEADAKIKGSMLKEGYALAVDSRLSDISSMETHLIGGAGTSAQKLKHSSTTTSSESYEQKITSTLSPLSTASTKYAEFIKKSQSGFPHNIDDKGTSVFYNDGSGDFEEHIQRANRIRVYETRVRKSFLLMKLLRDQILQILCLNHLKLMLKLLLILLELRSQI